MSNLFSCSSERRHTYLYLTNFRKWKCKRSLESKRRQRLSRNKRKREEKKQVKKGLTALIQGLQEENKSLSQKVKVQTAIKEKYFQMWRVSEKERQD